MVCVFMAAMGKAAGNKAVCTGTSRGGASASGCVSLDRETVLSHSMAGTLTYRQEPKASGVRWGRANAWILYSMAEILSCRQRDDWGSVEPVCRARRLSGVSARTAPLEQFWTIPWPMMRFRPRRESWPVWRLEEGGTS